MFSDGPQKLIPYGRQIIDETDIRAVTKVLRQPFITQGPGVELFEDALCQVTGAKHAVAVCNGTAALHLAYLAAGIGQGDEIITSPNSFLATANAAVFVGARPVFADIERKHQNIDPEDVESRITPRTRAVVAVDFAGQPADYKALRMIADKHELRLIADACHSFGGTYKGKRVGTLADVTCFSFHPVKSITTGEGGAILTDDKDIADVCRKARGHGVVRDPAQMEVRDGPWSYEMQTLGWNYRITDFQCALGTSQLSKLHRLIEMRRQLARRYGKLLGEVAGLGIPQEDSGIRSAWHLYPVEVPAARRREVFESLLEARIGVQVHYIPIYRQPFYRELLGVEPEAYPRCEEYYARTISLPLFPDLEPADQDRVVEALTGRLGGIVREGVG